MTAQGSPCGADPGTAQASLLERLGGEDRLRALVQQFRLLLGQMPGSWSLHRLGGRDPAARDAALMAYLRDWLGGAGPDAQVDPLPQGPCRLRAEERDEWLLCMRLALEATVSQIALRDAVWQVVLAAVARLVEDEAPVFAVPQERPGPGCGQSRVGVA